MKSDLEKELAFVLHAKGMGAISFEEFRNWIEKIISEQTDVPSYFFDLYDSDNLLHARQIVREKTRYYPLCELSDKESDVLSGIAIKRGFLPIGYEGTVTPKTALKRLEEYPHVVERFKKTFPFIQLDI